MYLSLNRYDEILMFLQVQSDKTSRHLNFRRLWTPQSISRHSRYMLTALEGSWYHLVDISCYLQIDKYKKKKKSRETFKKRCWCTTVFVLEFEIAKTEMCSRTNFPPLSLHFGESHIANRNWLHNFVSAFW